MMILIVEDDEDVASILSDTCHEAGYRSQTVADGHEAVRRSGEQRFSLVLMDLGIPGLRGVDAAAAIKALDEPYGSVPIIMVTGLLAPDDLLTMKPGTFAAAIHKPFSRAELISKIRRFSR